MAHTIALHMYACMHGVCCMLAPLVLLYIGIAPTRAAGHGPARPLYEPMPAGRSLLLEQSRRHLLLLQSVQPLMAPCRHHGAGPHTPAPAPPMQPIQNHTAAPSSGRRCLALHAPPPAAALQACGHSLPTENWPLAAAPHTDPRVANSVLKGGERAYRRLRRMPPLPFSVVPTGPWVMGSLAISAPLAPKMVMAAMPAVWHTEHNSGQLSWICCIAQLRMKQLGGMAPGPRAQALHIDRSASKAWPGQPGWQLLLCGSVWVRRACFTVQRSAAHADGPLTQGNEAAQGLTAAEDVSGLREELALQVGVALLLVLAVQVPRAGGVLHVLHARQRSVKVSGQQGYHTRQAGGPEEEGYRWGLLWWH